MKAARGRPGVSVVNIADILEYATDCVDGKSNQIFEASLTVVNASSVFDDNYERWGPEQALTPVSQENGNYWHSASDDDNPSITFKLQHEHEVLRVEVVDRQDCEGLCNERFQSVEVRVGYTPSFEEAQSCGIQSYEGETSYK